ncbi:MAG: hypothetical protein ACOCPN_03685 [Desulfonatronovibrionaceae bacterium]
MSAITASNPHNPAQQYTLVDRKTSGRRHLLSQARLDSIQKSIGFRWKNFGIEFQSRDYQVQEQAGNINSFARYLKEADQIRSLADHQEARIQEPPRTTPRKAATAYIRQAAAQLEYTNPMLSLAV